MQTASAQIKFLYGLATAKGINIVLHGFGIIVVANTSIGTARVVQRLTIVNLVSVILFRNIVDLTFYILSILLSSKASLISKVRYLKAFGYVKDVLIIPAHIHYNVSVVALASERLFAVITGTEFCKRMVRISLLCMWTTVLFIILLLLTPIYFLDDALNHMYNNLPPVDVVFSFLNLIVALTTIIAVAVKLNQRHREAARRAAKRASQNRVEDAEGNVKPGKTSTLAETFRRSEFYTPTLLVVNSMLLVALPTIIRVLASLDSVSSAVLMSLPILSDALSFAIYVFQYDEIRKFVVDKVVDLCGCAREGEETNQGPQQTHVTFQMDRDMEMKNQQGQ